MHLAAGLCPDLLFHMTLAVIKGQGGEGKRREVREAERKGMGRKRKGGGEEREERERRGGERERRGGEDGICFMAVGWMDASGAISCNWCSLDQSRILSRLYSADLQNHSDTYKCITFSLNPLPVS